MGDVMKKFVYATLAVALAGPAFAADMPLKAPPPPAPVFSWTGCYLGVHAGAGFKSIQSTVAVGSTLFPAGFVDQREDASGVLAGFQGGCDYQFAGGWVVGVEGDYAWTNVRAGGGGLRDDSPLRPGFFNIAHLKEPWLASVSGRLGYGWDRYLLYVKGGAAWSRFEHSADTFNAAGVNVAITSGEETRTAWLVGIGFEHAVAPGFSFFLEADYLDWGNPSTTSVVLTGVNAGELRFRTSRADEYVIKGGINWRFGGFGIGKGPVVARY
jgi:outer membrane immunogenic protein